ncbi:MAG: NAD(P)H-hydrate dehydratase [Rhodospirillaceae bacterium TMED63]|nr:bifunctional ADP-dependent NAD(P)H-hydrate dehydratase/NAD(P)H-hydrate epimerase [Rhodospirillaceae bacterium]RPF98611.1 MAG: NAD(P)H-hydrate dehydratase [Rhodospirillaceae bacterium TMED63]
MSDLGKLELLTVDQMYAADAAAVASGVTGEALMEAAGLKVAIEIRARWASRPVAVLCGPGNNGGDGFVVARHLAGAGWPVSLYLLGGREALIGDAALHAGRWTGDIHPLSPDALDGSELIVDALFGAGLARPLEGLALETVNRISETGAPCVAIDVPSGVNGDTGMVLGAAARAELTVTFFRRKPGHLLMPGRERAGSVVVADIGIPETVLEEIAPDLRSNNPGVWGDSFPWPSAGGHKYTRGHGVIVGGMSMGGAARLGSLAARRSGAGLVTVAASPEALGDYTADQPGLLPLPFRTAKEFGEILDDERKNGVLIGPGSGVSRSTQDVVLSAARRGRSLVLDADALTSFQTETDALFTAIADVPCVLTPHEGEFSRLFRMTGDKLTRARRAAEVSGSVVLLKGADTVIASPDGRAAINENAPPTLATAGAGDVLAGTILGLLVQGMPAFEAACAAVWLNGDVATSFGYGLIAEDLPAGFPAALSNLHEMLKVN